MCGPGVAAECLEVRDGLHVHEDHFIVEVVDPESGAGGGGRGGRARLHDAAQGGDAVPSLPHGRHRLGHVRAVPLRPDDGEDPRTARPPRRHGDRARRQRVSLQRRACAPLRSRRRSALPARRRAKRPDGRAHRPVRAHRPTWIPRSCARPSSGSCASSSGSVCARTCWSAGRCREARARPCASSTGADSRSPRRTIDAPPNLARRPAPSAAMEHRNRDDRNAPPPSTQTEQALPTHTVRSGSTWLQGSLRTANVEARIVPARSSRSASSATPRARWSSARWRRPDPHARCGRREQGLHRQDQGRRVQLDLGALQHRGLPERARPGELVYEES